jgi:hypothetical protein
MTTSLDRGLENSYIASYIEVTEVGHEVLFHSTWISNLSTNKKIGIRRITTEVDPEAGGPFNLIKGYSIEQGSSYYIYNIQINLNLRTKKMSEIGQIIVDRIKSREYVPSDVDVSFDYEDT